jgi:prepilin-type N-terminal cleavage/methylation domain-containing protein
MGRRNETGANAGFSLIELLIVVAIILIIAAIAIPNLLRARISANESSAASSVRTIASAQFEYNSAYPTVGFAVALANLGGAPPCSPAIATACLIDNTLATGTKSGYNFVSAGSVPAGGVNSAFVASSAPQNYNQTGVRDFCIVTDGVLRSNPGAAGNVPAPDVPTCQGYPIAQ